MQNSNIAILITTFLRDNLLYKTIQSIINNYPDNCIGLIADQGYSSDEKTTEISYYKSQISLEYYQVPFDCGLCIDNQTEILTNNGWKRYNTILKTDKALSLNPKNNEANYYPISNIYINKNYKGKMIEYNGKTVDFCITPNHRVFYKRYGKYKNNAWNLKSIKDIKDSWFHLQKNFLWKGISIRNFLIPPLYSKNWRLRFNYSRKININLWLQFLGWYISEGCINSNPKKGRYSILIAQNKNKYFAEIKSLLTKMNFSYDYNSHSFRIHDKQLWNWLKENCYKGNRIRIKSIFNCYNKKVPDFIKTLQPKFIEIFLDSFCKGDGTIEKHTGRKRYITSSKQLADDIQELILKIGKYATIDKIKPLTFFIKGKKIEPLKYHFRINEYMTNFKIATICQKTTMKNRNDTQLKSRFYNGLVWCITTTPHHLIYIRRNGKCHWTGNSYARNFLIQKAHNMKIEYILMSADSIQFVQKYDFEPYIKTLQDNKTLGIIGYSLNGSKSPWEFFMELTPNGILMKSSNEFIEYQGIKYKKVDICRNIFLAKTSTMLDLYDNDMRLCEHELAFLEYKKRGYHVWWTDSLTFQKMNQVVSDEYSIYRKRLTEYQQLLKQKLNISGWVKYSPNAMREIKEYKKLHHIQ
jgi:hypothetical protein